VAAVESVKELEARVAAQRRRWLVTGAAGFIGSHLVQALLQLDQLVVGLDNFATGNPGNLDQIRDSVGADAWRRFGFIEGDIADLAVCRAACQGAQIILHEAALGSVPRSIDDPLATHRANATGFLSMLVASRDAGVRRFVYAGSSSTYGDHPDLPKVESVIGQPLSPYGATKLFNEIYAEVFGRCFGFETVGLRYFNIFGPRQDPDGPYAAVIPRWAAQMLSGVPCTINGDGQTSRDFCYVANAVQANLRAATIEASQSVGQVYNIAAGGRTTLAELHSLLAQELVRFVPDLLIAAPRFADYRLGDVRHSQADISKAARLLGYLPTHDVRAGLTEVAQWYARRHLHGAGGNPAPAA